MPLIVTPPWYEVVTGILYLLVLSIRVSSVPPHDNMSSAPLYRRSAPFIPVKTLHVRSCCTLSWFVPCRGLYLVVFVPCRGLYLFCVFLHGTRMCLVFVGCLAPLFPFIGVGFDVWCQLSSMKALARVLPFHRLYSLHIMYLMHRMFLLYVQCCAP